MKIKFADTEHKEFFLAQKEKCSSWDCYHMALFYTLGLSGNCRNYIHDLYSYQEGCIKPKEALLNGWVTSDSSKVIRMAYNLFNGFIDGETSPDDLFCDSNAPFFHEAVKLRYPEFHGERYCVKDQEGNILMENITEKLIGESYCTMYEKKTGTVCTLHPQEEISLVIE